MVERRLRLLRRSSSSRSPRRSASNSGPRADDRVLLRGRLDAAHDRACRYIRAAAILQLLLGNIGRPGGGIMALRGHATIQGSTDIPTLYNLLPGYLPHAARAAARRATPRRRTSTHDDAARPAGGANFAEVHRQPAEGLVRRRRDARRTTSASTSCRGSTGDHSHMPTDASTWPTARSKGYFVIGQNPAVGSAERRASQREALRQARLAGGARHLRDRDGGVLVRRARGRARRAAAPEEIETEVFFFPAAAAHARRTAPSPTRSGCCSGTTRRSSRPATAAPSSGSSTTSAGGCKELYAGSTEPAATGRSSDLTLGLPDARARIERARRRGACCARSTATTVADRQAARRASPSCKDDGSTGCGCWIYSRRATPDGVNQAARRKPGAASRRWVALGVGLGLAGEPAHPLQPRLGRPGRAARGRERKKLRLVGRASSGSGPATTSPDFVADQAAGLPAARRAPRGSTRSPAIDPFIMKADGKGWLFAPQRPAGRPAADALRAAWSRRSRTRSTAQQCNPARDGLATAATTRTTRPCGDPRYPYVAHHLPADRAPHRRRHEPLAVLAGRAAARSCSARSRPELAREKGIENGGWVTHHHRARRDRGARAGHATGCRPLQRATGRTVAPGRAALALGLRRAA